MQSTARPTPDAAAGHHFRLGVKAIRRPSAVPPCALRPAASPRGGNAPGTDCLTDGTAQDALATSSAAQPRESPGARSQTHAPTVATAALIALHILMLGPALRRDMTRASIRHALEPAVADSATR